MTFWSNYYKIARSFALFRLRKCMQLPLFYRKYTRTLSTLLWNLMSRNLTSLRCKCQFLINIKSHNTQVRHHLFLPRHKAFCVGYWNRLIYLSSRGVLSLDSNPDPLTKWFFFKEDKVCLSWSFYEIALDERWSG